MAEESGEDDGIDSLLREFSVSERYFTVSINDEGRPPLVRHVGDTLYLVDSDLTNAYAIAELQEFIIPYLENTEMHIADVVRARLKAIALDFEILSDNEYVVQQALSYYSVTPPKEINARVVEATHSNPLETLILVSATAAVMTTLSTMYAIRKWRQSKSEQEAHQAVTKMIDAVAIRIAHGDERTVKALRPIASEIVSKAFQGYSSTVSIDVAKAAKLKF